MFTVQYNIKEEHFSLLTSPQKSGIKQCYLRFVKEKEKKVWIFTILEEKKLKKKNLFAKC